MLELDKADKNSQRPETYDAMLKTTEREAKDQITKQINKYTRNGGRRYCRVSTGLSEIESVESKVETEMLSVKMHLTKMTRWNQVQQANKGDDLHAQRAEEVKVVMSARNAWMNSASSQEANDAWEKNLNVSTQDKPNDHHHRREGKLSQSEIDRMVEEAENYRDEDEPRAQQVEHRDQAHETLKNKPTELSKPARSAGEGPGAQQREW